MHITLLKRQPRIIVFIQNILLPLLMYNAEPWYEQSIKEKA